MTRRNFDALFLAPFLQAAFAQETYTAGPDSQRQEGVPRGTLTRLTWDHSEIFPGTTREWAIYVPAQYGAAKSACVMFFFDGMGFILEDRSWRTLFITAGPRIYRRKIRRQGALPWQPVKPPPSV